MPFKSSEIRWLSTERKLFATLFESIANSTRGVAEPLRLDYYSHNWLSATGIKVHEENYEVKVKIAPDKQRAFVRIEHWVKWSSAENENILSAVPERMLSNWIAVKKQGFKKSYAVINGGVCEDDSHKFLNEGCGLEFTKLRLAQLNRYSS